MPSFLALSARLSVMPVPGNTMTACGTSARRRSLRLKGAALPSRSQSGLNAICVTLRLSAQQAAMRSAPRRAAMQQNHAGIVGERLIEHLPDALVIVAGRAAGKRDTGAFRQMHLGFGAALGGEVFAAFKERSGKLGVVDEAAGAGPPAEPVSVW